MSQSLQSAHGAILQLRKLEDAPLLRALDAILADIYYALDGRYDPLASTRRALQVVAQVQGSPLLEPTLFSQLHDALQQAEREFALLQFRAQPRPHSYPITSGVLSLHNFERQVLLAPTSDQTPIDFFSDWTPQEFSEAYLAEPLPPFSPEGWQAIRLQQYLQDVASLALQLAPQLGDQWRSLRFIESRIFAQIDAAHSLSSQLGYLELAFESSPAPDPAQLAALALILGSLQGRDGIAVSERCLEKIWDQEEDALIFIGHAYAILPQPFIENISLSWLSEPRAAFRAQGVELRFRRESLTAEQALHACADEEQVACAALMPLVILAPQEARSFIAREHGRFQVASQTYQFAYSKAACLAGDPSHRAQLFYWVEMGEKSVATWAGIAAEQADALRLLELAKKSPSEALIKALGWAGDPACLSFLIQCLSLDDESLIIAAATALERITGAQLYDDYPIAVEASMEEEQLDALMPEPEPNPREPEPEPEPELLTLPSRDPQRWSDYIQAHQEQLVAHVRTRRGYPYSPLVSLYELDQLELTSGEREMAAYEIMLRSGLLFHFDARALVAQQERKITSLREILSQKAWQAGAWALPQQRNYQPI